MTGGTGRAGGDGVVHSPTSIDTSATTPSKGARRTVFARTVRATETAASARAELATAVRHAASAVRWALSTESSRSVETISSSARERIRRSSRSARSAARQARSWSARAASSSRAARSS